jgi:chloramphenicol-sensitive protein RarD
LSRETRAGVAFAGGAFLIWGVTPIYWKLLKQIPALELLAHRVVWALALVAVWMTLRRRCPDLVTAGRRPRTLAALLASTACIAVNWGLFIWAVNTDRVLSTSLGYYINPLVSVLLGLVVLRERLNRRQWLAVGLAAVAVAILTSRVGHPPWISLGLAFSFGFYGLLRKTVAADAVVGLTFETAALTPLCVGFLAWRERIGAAAFSHQGVGTDLLLVAAGAVTAVPLLLFTLGARRLPLSTVGLLQYIAPTCTFVLAVFLYSEPFTLAHGIAFVLIWTALAIYTLDLRSRLRRVEAG